MSASDEQVEQFYCFCLLRCTSVKQDVHFQFISLGVIEVEFQPGLMGEFVAFVVHKTFQRCNVFLFVWIFTVKTKPRHNKNTKILTFFKIKYVWI